jgi:glycosyltransferase involved in cell wall biosynthesis
MKKRKVLFVDHDPGITGSTVSMKYLIRGFYEAGWDVLILSPKDEKSLMSFQEFNVTSIKLEKHLNLELHFLNILPVFSLRGIKANVFLLIYFIKGFFYAVRKLSKIKPELVYVNEYVLSQFSTASKFLNIPVVTHIRSPFLKGTFGLRRYLFSELLLKCNNYLFAITEQEAIQICKKTNKNIAKVKVVYEFLDKNDFAIPNNINILKAQFSIPKDVFVLLTLGGVEEIKGTYETIQAFSKTYKIISKIKLIIAGPITNNLEYYKKCLDLIDVKGLTSKVDIIGFKANVRDLISCADIVLACSIKSHFSRPIVEAWAQRKPIISSDIIHSRQIVDDDINGLLYTYNQPEELAKKIICLINQPEKRKTMAEAGYSKAISLYKMEKNVGKIINYCSSLIQ